MEAAKLDSTLLNRLLDWAPLSVLLGTELDSKSVADWEAERLAEDD